MSVSSARLEYVHQGQHNVPIPEHSFRSDSLSQVFLENFVHGDLHPGNLLVDQRDDKLRLVVLDAGIVCKLGDEDRRNFVDLFHAIVVGDGKLAGRLMIERVSSRMIYDLYIYVCSGMRFEVSVVIDKIPVAWLMDICRVEETSYPSAV